MLKRYSFIAHGKVQGVFFRAGTIKIAKELQITGWVKNAADGTVVGEAQSSSEADLKKFKEKVKNMPGEALVDKAKFDKNWQEIPAVEVEKGFEKRY